MLRHLLEPLCRNSRPAFRCCILEFCNVSRRRVRGLTGFQAQARTAIQQRIATPLKAISNGREGILWTPLGNPAPALAPSARAAPRGHASLPVPILMRCSGTPRPYLRREIRYGTLQAIYHVRAACSIAFTAPLQAGQSSNKAACRLQGIS